MCVGWVAVPGHQPERERSEDERPLKKLPDTGFHSR